MKTIKKFLSLFVKKKRNSGPIQASDLIAPGVFDNIIRDAKELLRVLSELENKLIAVQEASKRLKSK